MLAYACLPYTNQKKKQCIVVYLGLAMKSVLNSQAFPGLGRATPRPRRERRCVGGKVRRIMGAAGAAVECNGSMRKTDLRCFTVPDHGQNPKKTLSLL